MTKTAGPIFIIGRQHSDNTMLARCLGRAPEVHSVTGEGQFFEHQAFLDDKSTDEKIASVMSLVEQSGAEIPQEARSELRDHMRRSRAKEVGRTAVAMYARCMEWLTQRKKAERWAQKATSYIFHVEDVLESFPNARHLARSPLDLAASLHEASWRLGLGCADGIRLE